MWFSKMIGKDVPEGFAVYRCHDCKDHIIEKEITDQKIRFHCPTCNRSHYQYWWILLDSKEENSKAYVCA